jgi:hypothetical protein
MKDFIGNTLSEGDTVVMMNPRYRELCLAKISRFTACFVFVRIHGWSNDMKQTSDQLVKIKGTEEIKNDLP